MTRPFSQVDVFTDTLGLGNPVAVVHDADGLSTEAMQRFASWTNLSETTFLCSATDPTANYRLRIFTTERELPFAGHPTLGSARAWLAAGGTPRTDGTIVQECEAGLITIRRDHDRLAFAAPPLRRSGPVDPNDVTDIAAALAISSDDVVDAQWGDNGPGWVMILLGSADEVLALRPDGRLMGRFPDIGVAGPHPDHAEIAYEVRTFFGSTATEDPVTGSFNAALGQWLTGTGRAPDSYVAAQGTVLGRRGRIHVDRIGDDVWIGGDTVIGVRGTVDLG